MGGRDQRLAMPHPAERERIEEEIDRMDMDEIGLAEVREDLGRNGIARRAAEGDASDRDAVDHLACRQDELRPGEQPVERHHGGLETERQLCPAEIGDDVFQPAAIGEELAHDMEDARAGRQGGRGAMGERGGHGLASRPQMALGRFAFKRSMRTFICGRSPALVGSRLKT
jgi:hypothetical protein